MRLLAAAAAALVALPCLADSVFHAKEPAQVSLLRGSLTREEDADLVVTERVLRAPRGVRREAGREQFSSSVGLALGDVYLVRDSRGAEHRVRVSVFNRGFVRVELLNERSTLGVTPPARYRCAAVTVNDQPAGSGFGELTLNVDGTYRLGQARGTWRIVDDAVQLEGAVAHWGWGRSFDGGRTLRFSFRRGPVEWVLNYAREEDAAVAAR
ncbi:MAG: hypothetical protein AB1730_17550 [Myxococcota bacterium]|jgi:hypothetical protein